MSLTPRGLRQMGPGTCRYLFHGLAGAGRAGAWLVIGAIWCRGHVFTLGCWKAGCAQLGEALPFSRSSPSIQLLTWQMGLCTHTRCVQWLKQGDVRLNY
jgi:hypothetical protein